MIKKAIVLNSGRVYVGEEIVEMQNTVVLVSGEKRTQFGKGSIKRVEEINVHNYIRDLVEELDEVNVEHIMADGRLERWIEIAQFHEAHQDYAKCDDVIAEVAEFVEKRSQSLLTPSNVKVGDVVTIFKNYKYQTCGKVVAITGMDVFGHKLPQIIVKPLEDIEEHSLEMTWFFERSRYHSLKTGHIVMKNSKEAEVM